MKTIGHYNFPTTAEEAGVWKPVLAARALAPQVVAVAKTRVEGAWTAYIDAVPGKCHVGEREEVLRTGTKLPENVARALFPLFDKLPYAD